MKRILLLSLIAGIIVAVYYFIFSKMERQKSNSIFSVPTSEDQKYTASLTDKDIEKLVFNTIPEHALKPGFGGKVFCSSKVYGFDYDVTEKNVFVYIYAYCQEYYLKGDVTTLGSEVSSPLKLTYKSENQNLVFASMTSPKAGDGYTGDINTIFPEKYVNDVLKGVDLSTLVPSPKTQADNYYKGKLEVYF